MTLSKNDVCKLIRAAEAAERIAGVIADLTGASLQEQYDGINEVADILRRYSGSRYTVSKDLDADDENYERFMEVLRDETMDQEEKYDMLMAE